MNELKNSTFIRETFSIYIRIMKEEEINMIPTQQMDADIFYSRIVNIILFFLICCIDLLKVEDH